MQYCKEILQVLVHKPNPSPVATPLSKGLRIEPERTLSVSSRIRKKLYRALFRSKSAPVSHMDARKTSTAPIIRQKFMSGIPFRPTDDLPSRAVTSDSPASFPTVSHANFLSSGTYRESWSWTKLGQKRGDRQAISFQSDTEWWQPAHRRPTPPLAELDPTSSSPKALLLSSTNEGFLASGPPSSSPPMERFLRHSDIPLRPQGLHNEDDIEKILVDNGKEAPVKPHPYMRPHEIPQTIMAWRSLPHPSDLNDYPTLNLTARTDLITHQQYILWRDIMHTFPGATSLVYAHNWTTVPLMKNENFEE